MRLMLIMVLSLVTSSYVFRNLGVNDYGIYNVVGGVVVVLAFLNHAMVATTQRYLSFNLDNEGKLIEIFTTSKTIHFCLAVLILIFGETVGLYFVNNYLKFDGSRTYAVNIVYQLSLISVVFMTVNVPYLSIILVNQKIRFYAIVGVIEATLKLILAYSLMFFSFDKLIVYAFILFIITLLSYSLYYFYAIKKFIYIARLSYMFSFKKMKEMIVFSSWNLVGVFAGLGQNVGVNILLNIYFRTEINSSRALSLQIYNAINNVNTSAQTIYSPLIIRKYASKGNDLLEYVYMFSKLSFFITLLLVVPIFYYLEELLELWINNIPSYLVIFIRIMLLELLIVSFSGPLHSLIQADGNIKWYQIGVSGLLLLNIPLGVYFYSKDYTPEFIYYISFFLTSLSIVFRIAILSKKREIIISNYVYNVIFPVIISIVLIYLCHYLINSNILKLLIIELLILLFAIYTLFTSVNVFSLIAELKDRVK